jgi:glycosyltransferase involved in cell wall biosynthesis
VDRHRVAIVIPALNEVATIGRVVRNALQYGTVIVVSDGSTDQTASVARGEGAIVVEHTKPQGYENAIESGFRCAITLEAVYVITIDADGQHDPSAIPRFVAELEAGAEVVLGIRTRVARLGEHVFAWVASAKWGISDPLCGMKGYRLEVYREYGCFDSYRSVGTELAIFAARRGRTIVQVHVTGERRRDSPRFGSRLSANRRIFRALWGALTPGRRQCP